MDRLIANVISAFIPTKNGRRKVRAYFGRNKFSPLRPLARFALPRILPTELHNAVVFELSCGLSDQIRTICFAKHFYDNWQGEKPTIIINVGKLVDTAKIKPTLRPVDDAELQSLLSANKRSYNPKINRYASHAFELGGYTIDWSWVAGFIAMPKKWVSLYDLFGHHYLVYDTLSFCNGQTFTPPIYIRSFTDSKLFELPSVLAFFNSMTANLTGANAAKHAEIKGTPRSICVHIRRGDYIAHNEGLTLPAVYFEKAVSKIITQTGWKQATLFVFSDDWDWTERAIDFRLPNIDLSTDFIRLNDISNPIPELELMSACQHFVISVGNFASMAAKKSGNPTKIVITPSKNDFVKSGRTTV